MVDSLVSVDAPAVDLWGSLGESEDCTSRLSSVSSMKLGPSAPNLQ